MTILTATRETSFGWANKITILRDENSRVKKVYSGKYQPRKGKPTLTINGKLYAIDWTKATKL